MIKAVAPVHEMIVTSQQKLLQISNVSTLKLIANQAKELNKHSYTLPVYMQAKTNLSSLLWQKHSQVFHCMAARYQSLPISWNLHLCAHTQVILLTSLCISCIVYCIIFVMVCVKIFASLDMVKFNVIIVCICRTKQII